MNKSLLTFTVVGVLLIALAWAVGGHEISDYAPYYFQRIIGKSAKVGNRDQVFKVEVAKSDRAKVKGLSNRKKIPQDKGMLFVFDKPEIYEFWMKDMLVPLDIVWINDSKIVDISRSISPPAKNAESAKVRSKAPAQHVLEIYAGTVPSWQVGDSVDITFDNWF